MFHGLWNMNAKKVKFKEQSISVGDVCLFPLLSLPALPLAIPPPPQMG